MKPVQLVQRPDDFSDVTLVFGDAQVCTHFKFGFCKFGERCNKKHLKEICQTEDCKLKTCNKRHPKICKFFSVNQVCKFGDACCYKHKLSAHHSNILEQISSLHATISSMSESIQALEDEILKLRSPLSPLESLRGLDTGGDLVPSPDKSCIRECDASLVLDYVEEGSAPALVHCHHTYTNGSTGLVTWPCEPCPLHPCCVMCEIMAASEESRPPRFCNFQSDPSCPRPCSGAIFDVDISSAQGHDYWKVLDFILVEPSLLEFRL